MRFKLINFALLTFFTTKCFGENCKTTGSVYGFALEGHTVRSFVTSRLAACYSVCNVDSSCQSMNFNLNSNTCEVNEETDRSRPQSFKRIDGYVYAQNPDRAKKGSEPIAPGQSCKDIRDSGDFTSSGNYWIRPEESRESFQAYCDMSVIDEWIKIDQSWVQETFNGGVSLTFDEENDGLVIGGTVTSYGCGSPGSGALTYITGYWTKIKYTQEFRGLASCWAIFGSNIYKEGHGGVDVGTLPRGLHNFDVSQGDVISDEFYMGGDTHSFDGRTYRCDNERSNFCDNPSRSVRSATVELRRNLTSEKAGIFTGTSCGQPSYVIKNIYVFF